jgi:hypothetical protein
MNKKNTFIMIGILFLMISIMILPNLKADLDIEKVNQAQMLADAGIIENNKANP